MGVFTILARLNFPRISTISNVPGLPDFGLSRAKAQFVFRVGQKLPEVISPRSSPGSSLSDERRL